MIHRILIISKMKDKIKEEVNKQFPSYIMCEIDKYTRESKDVGFIVEIDGLGDDKIVSVNKVASDIAQKLNVPVLVQRFESASKIVKPNESV